jgi:hypothetical protein
MRNSQEIPKKVGKKYFIGDKDISRSNYYRLCEQIKKDGKNGKVPKNSQTEKSERRNPPRKTSLVQKKELIDYNAISKYRVITKIAQVYQKHFNNKGIRVTNRLQRYINVPKDMIRMSLILEKGD